MRRKKSWGPMKQVHVVVAACLCVLALVFSGAPSHAADVIKIGGLYPLSGGAAEFSNHAVRGLKMAVDEINTKGGITIQGKKLKIELVLYDTKCDPTSGVAAAEKMIHRDKVVVINGAVCSTVSLATKEVSDANKIVQLTCLSLHPEVTAPGYPYMFRLCNTVGMYAEPFSEFIANKLKAKKIGMLVVTDDYGHSAVKTYSDLFKKKGIDVCAVEYMKHGETDLYTQITKILAANPDAVYIGSQENAQLVGSLKQLKELDFKGHRLGVSVFATDDMLRLGGKELLEGFYMESPPFEMDKDKPVIKEWIKKYKNREGRDANAFSLWAYQSIYCLANVIQSANTITDKDKILESMKTTNLRDLLGFYGKPRFSEVGQAQYLLGALQYQNGKRVVVYRTK